MSPSPDFRACHLAQCTSRRPGRIGEHGKIGNGQKTQDRAKAKFPLRTLMARLKILQPVLREISNSRRRTAIFPHRAIEPQTAAAHPSWNTPATALLLSRKEPRSVTYVSGMNCYPSVGKGTELRRETSPMARPRTDVSVAFRAFAPLSALPPLLITPVPPLTTRSASCQ